MSTKKQVNRASENFDRQIDIEALDISTNESNHEREKKPDELEQVIAEEDEDEDWGEVEQKAYERLQEDGVKHSWRRGSSVAINGGAGM